VLAPFFLTLLLVGMPGSPAQAASISSVSGTAGVTLTGVGGAPEPSDYYMAAAFGENCGAGCTDFTGSLQAGAGVEADSGENLRIDMQWTWTVDILVDATATEAWELNVDMELAGYFTTINQGGGSARARLTAVSGTLDAGGTGTTGSMDLAGTDTINTSVDTNQALTRMSSFSVVGGFGPQTVSMTFTMDGRLRSQCTGGGCGGQGDEAAIRLGIPASGTPPAFVAGLYPGPDGDPANVHGVFLGVTLVPEPGALWLAASALAGFAFARRFRH
jgi:hypothetical protein